MNIKTDPEAHMDSQGTLNSEKRTKLIAKTESSQNKRPHSL